jgi:hypothetical protein
MMNQSEQQFHYLDVHNKRLLLSGFPTVTKNDRIQITQGLYKSHVTQVKSVWPDQAVNCFVTVDGKTLDIVLCRREFILLPAKVDETPTKVAVSKPPRISKPVPRQEVTVKKTVGAASTPDSPVPSPIGKLGAKEQQVIELLQTHPNVKPALIAEKLGWDAVLTRQVCIRLKNKKLVNSLHGTYSLSSV